MYLYKFVKKKEKEKNLVNKYKNYTEAQIRGCPLYVDVLAHNIFPFFIISSIYLFVINTNFICGFQVTRTDVASTKMLKNLYIVFVKILFLNVYIASTVYTIVSVFFQCTWITINIPKLVSSDQTWYLSTIKKICWSWRQLLCVTDTNLSDLVIFN